MTLSPGSIFADRYLAKKSLGTAGMARLYDSYDILTDRPVTLRVVPRVEAAGPLAGRRWQREAQALSAIVSPYVVRYLDHVETSEEVGLVTESLDGVDLRSYIALYGPLPLDSLLSIGLQIARGLHACHTAGVIHRDLRPENVFVAADETVKIVNFALAGIEDATTLTMTGTMFGEPEYASPESFVCAPSDARIDTYSLGVVLWEMVVGESPFQGNGIVEILEQKSSRELPRVSSHDTTVPPWLDGLIAVMTARDPNGRPSSLGQVIRSLEQKQRVLVESSSAGQCLACGHVIFRGIDFCSYCGESAVGEDQAAEVSVCVIKAVGDVEATRKLLRRSFTCNPTRDIDAALKRPPFSLVESGSIEQSRWLIRSLEKVRCVVDLNPLSQWYFKQSSVIATLTLSALLMLTVNVDSFMQRSTVPENAFGSGVYLLGKLHFVLACFVAIRLYLKRCGFRYRDQPVLWLRGAWGFVLGSGASINILRRFGRMALLLMIVGTMLLSAVILRDIALMVFRMVDIVAFSLSPRGLGGPLVFVVFPVALTALSLVGLLVLIVRLVGRIGGPPLFRFDANGEPHPSVSWGSVDVHLLNRLRTVARSTGLDDLRFVISDTVESFLSFIRVKTGVESQPGSAVRDLQEKIHVAIETIVDTGETVLDLGGRTSPDIKEALEASILRLRRKVAEEQRPAAEHAAALLRDAEEEVILWEVDSDLLNRQLNAMRILSGEIRGSVAQLMAIAGDIGDEERARRELFQLSETLIALNPVRLKAAGGE